MGNRLPADDSAGSSKERSVRAAPRSRRSAQAEGPQATIGATMRGVESKNGGTAARKMRIAEVARHASVSVATVSRVLNGQPQVGEAYRKRVLDAISELDYRPNRVARSLRKQRSAMIGVIVADIENAYFSAAIRAIENAAFEKGYRVLVCNTDESAAKQEAYLQALEEERVLGVIISPSDPDSLGVTSLLEEGIPVVGLDRAVSDPRADAVLPDNLNGARTATQFLLDSGHRDVAILAGPLSTETATERLAGYEVTMRAALLEPHAIDGGFRSELAYEAVTRLLGRSALPAALVVSNNLMMLGALKAAREAGLRVPDDLAIVGIGDPEWAALIDPPLTTMAVPVRRMALDAMELLLQRVLRSRDNPRRIIHPMELRIRASHKRPS
jgi:LacI family transcriptional regulator